MQKCLNIFCTFDLPKSFILIFVLNLIQIVISNDRNLVLFPESFQTIWYSREEGSDTQISFSETDVDLWGTPLAHSSYRQDVHDYVFRRPAGCYVCSRFYVRSWNVMERYDSSCMSTNLTHPDFERLNEIGCEHTFELGRRMMNSIHKLSSKTIRSRGVLMLREDPSPINCRHSIHGNFRFAYQIQDSFTGECLNHRSRLHSCETPGSQFFISNQKFLLEFKKCEGMKNSYDASGEYMCLGEWREGLQQFFVATNLRESRKEERFKCFLKNREDPNYLGMSRTASCTFLLTPDNSPIRLRLEALQESIEPSCFFPNNASGTWVSSGLGEPQVEINSTHIIESRWIGYQLRKDINVCVQQKGRRFLMAKISEFGCQAEFVCWEMLPRHHNVIRYRKSRAMIRNSFYVCDYKNFENERHWKYDTLINEDAKPVECPFSGRFTFGQKGPSPLQTRVLNGITQSPLDTYHCPNRQTDFSICDSDRKNIIIDLDYCFSLDKYGHPADIKSIPDYRLNCVGYWKENLVSYLITYDPSDSVSRYRCWVYQRVSMTELRLSQGLGSSCGLNQMHTSFTPEEGAAVALNLTFVERIHDRCPLYYNDGKNPWVDLKNELVIFRFLTSGVPSVFGNSIYWMNNWNQNQVHINILPRKKLSAVNPFYVNPKEFETTTGSKLQEMISMETK